MLVRDQKEGHRNDPRAGKCKDEGTDSIEFVSEKAGGDLITLVKYLYKKKRLDSGVGLCSFSDKSITRYSGWKVKLDKFSLEIKCSFLAGRVIKHWSSLLKEAVQSPLLGVLNLTLDGFLKACFNLPSGNIFYGLYIIREARLDDASGSLLPRTLQIYAKKKSKGHSM